MLIVKKFYICKDKYELGQKVIAIKQKSYRKCDSSFFMLSALALRKKSERLPL